LVSGTIGDDSIKAIEWAGDPATALIRNVFPLQALLLVPAADRVAPKSPQGIRINRNCSNEIRPHHETFATRLSAFRYYNPFRTIRPSRQRIRSYFLREGSDVLSLPSTEGVMMAIALGAFPAPALIPNAFPIAAGAPNPPQGGVPQTGSGSENHPPKDRRLGPAFRVRLRDRRNRRRAKRWTSRGTWRLRWSATSRHTRRGCRE
jgi:hypothetical protein